MYWLLKWVVLGPLIRWLTRPRVIGRLPDGPLVLAANHQAEIDSLVLCAALPRRLTFVAKGEYFRQGHPGARLYGTLCRLTGQIPIDRRGGDAAEAALLAGRDVLRHGGVWAIYPEGTRSPDGRLYRGRTGAMRVALSEGAKVVPVGVVGTRSVNEPGSRVWRRGRVDIRIGRAIDTDAWPEATDPAAWRDATDSLMRDIQRLTGQAYVDRHPTADELSARDRAPRSS